MAGQLKIGGNVIATHAGSEGAGTVTLDSSTLTIGSNTTVQGTVTGVIGNDATLPSGTVVSVHQTDIGSDISMSAGTSYYNNVNLNFQPKSATSKFIIIVAGRYVRGSTSSAAYMGYTMKNGSLGTADITNRFVTDDTRHNYNTVLFKAESGTGSVTWSVGDTLYFGSFFQSNGISATMNEYNLTVFEHLA